VKFKYISVEKNQSATPLFKFIAFFYYNYGKRNNNLDLLAAAADKNNYQLQTNHSHLFFSRLAYALAEGSGVNERSGSKLKSA
jgi:hypothetical protein